MKKNWYHRRTLLASASIAASAIVSCPAIAQDAEASTEADQAIVVTGSRIRGIEPVGSNVISVNAEKIAQEPVTSTSDLLRRVPQVVSLGANRNGGSAQNGAANATRGAGINLRGISTNATLLLYDGKRLPPQGTQGQYTDPSAIPTIALERVEVVADGSSAIYGSDAIAGVVNFILRRNFNGVEMRGRAGFADGGYREHQVAGLIGTTWEGGSVMLAAEMVHNEALLGEDLAWYQDDNRSRGGRDLRSTNCDRGTITVPGSPTTYAIPADGVTPATSASLIGGTRNQCFYGGLDTVIPEQTRYNVTASLSQDLGDNLRFFADGFYSHRKGEIAGLSNVNASVPSTNPFFVTPTVGAPSVNVAWSLVPTLGGADYNAYRGETWNVSTGFELQMGSGWKATGYFAHGESSDVADRKIGINGGALNSALADTNPLTALNVFGGVNNPATIAKIRDNLFIITGRTRLDVVNGQIDGDLFEIPGGAVKLAAGAEWRNEYTYTDLITGQANAGTPRSVNDAGSREVAAVFAELYVPIVGSGNATPGIEQLSLSVAARHENYSDFGSTTNPKFGVTYKPFDMLTLRGSYGTSFRAPTFTEVSTIAGGAGLYFDTLPGASGNQIGIGIAGGNPDLKPETARTWSVGGEIRSFDGFRASLTYFDIDYKNQIQALRGTPGILTNPIYASFVQFNPTPAEVAALVSSGLPVNQPITQSAVTFIVDGRRQNLGRSLVRGLDFAVNYATTTGPIEWDLGIQGTYYTKYMFRALPTAGINNVLGLINFPQKFRSQADIGAKLGIFSSRLTWNHVAGYTNNTSTVVPKVANYDTFDLSVGVDVLEHARISFDVRNLLNEDPPFVDTTRGYDPQSANPIPRMFSMSASVKF